MAKKSSVEKNNRRMRMIKSSSNKRAALKKVVMSKDLSFEDRLEAQIKLAEMPRNSSSVRHRNRCGLTGRPRGYYRKFNLSRIAVRELGNFGQIPGLVKASW
ncbi:MAG: 30S ribosomal protein S14 [Alphaproteobacteria bacterium]|jgi:small subunit ribosomal protein S14|nr:MAG: 30S ribosomal protein S14 [Alphaproteobacteria bacterium]